MSSKENLNAIAIDVVAKYNETAKHLVATYVAGTTRAVNDSTAFYGQLVNDGVKQSLLNAQQNLAVRLTDTVTQVSARADSAIDALSQRVVDLLQRVKEKASENADSPIL